MDYQTAIAIAYGFAQLILNFGFVLFSTFLVLKVFGSK